MWSVIHPGLEPASCPSSMSPVVLSGVAGCPLTPQLSSSPSISLHLINMLSRALLFWLKEKGHESLGGRVIPRGRRPELPGEARRDRSDVWSL